MKDLTSKDCSIPILIFSSFGKRRYCKVREVENPNIFPWNNGYIFTILSYIFVIPVSGESDNWLNDSNVSLLLMTFMKFSETSLGFINELISLFKSKALLKNNISNIINCFKFNKWCIQWNI